jgi:hypothetical protein
LTNDIQTPAQLTLFGPESLKFHVQNEFWFSISEQNNPEYAPPPIHKRAMPASSDFNFKVYQL